MLVKTGAACDVAAREHLSLRLSVAFSAIDHPPLGHLLFSCDAPRALAALTRLTFMNLSHCKVTDAALNALASLTSLSHLRLAGCVEVTKEIR
jgi:hypothetical protein